MECGIITFRETGEKKTLPDSFRYLVYSSESAAEEIESSILYSLYFTKSDDTDLYKTINKCLYLSSYEYDRLTTEYLFDYYDKIDWIKIIVI